MVGGLLKLATGNAADAQVPEQGFVTMLFDATDGAFKYILADGVIRDMLGNQAMLLSGIGIPNGISALNGTHYIDTDMGRLYKMVNNSWVLKYTFHQYQIPKLFVTPLANKFSINSQNKIFNTKTGTAVSGVTTQPFSKKIDIALTIKSNDRKFFDLEPRIFLYKWKRRKKKGIRYRDWVHPSNYVNNGQPSGGNRYYRGLHTITDRLNPGNTITVNFDRTTEWDLVDQGFFSNGGKIVTIDPSDWYPDSTGNRRTTDFPIKIDTWVNSGFGSIDRKNKSKMMLRFGIAIKNPKYSVSNTSQPEYLEVGPLSDTIIIGPKSQTLYDDLGSNMMEKYYIDWYYKIRQ